MAPYASGGAGKEQSSKRWNWDSTYKEQLEQIDMQFKKLQDEYNKYLPRFLGKHDDRLRSLKAQDEVDQEEMRRVESSHLATWKSLIEGRNKANGELVEKRAIIQAAVNALLPTPVDWSSVMARACQKNTQKHEERVQAKKAKEDAEIAAELAAIEEKHRRLKERRKLEERLAMQEAAAAAAEAEQERRRGQRAQREAQEAEKQRREKETERQRREQARKAQEAEAEKQRLRREREAKEREEQEARARANAVILTLDEARDQWQRAWTTLLAPKTRSAKDLYHDDITWPGTRQAGKPLDLSIEGLRRFLLEPTDKDRLAARSQDTNASETAAMEAIAYARLRSALLCFHPDKFFTSRCFARVRQIDQERVRKGVEEVAKGLTALVCERRGA